MKSGLQTIFRLRGDAEEWEDWTKTSPKTNTTQTDDTSFRKGIFHWPSPSEVHLSNSLPLAYLQDLRWQMNSGMNVQHRYGRKHRLRSRVTNLNRWQNLSNISPCCQQWRICALRNHLNGHVVSCAMCILATDLRVKTKWKVKETMNFFTQVNSKF